MTIRYNFCHKKINFEPKVLRTNLLAKILGSQQTMVTNAIKTQVKQKKPWFVKCNEKLCELLRRFLSKYFIYLSLNNNIKIPLFERLGFFEVRNIWGKYFVFHMNLAIQEACRILDESIISIEKSSLSNTLWNSYYKGS